MSDVGCPRCGSFKIVMESQTIGRKTSVMEKCLNCEHFWFRKERAKVKEGFLILHPGQSVDYAPDFLLSGTKSTGPR